MGAVPLLAAVGCTCLAALALAAGTSQFAEYPLPIPQQDPVAIVAGPDGNLWFTLHNSSQLGIATPAGQVRIEPGLSSPGEGIASAAGDLWVTEPNANAVARVTPSLTVTVYTLGQGSDPTGIAAGPDGNVWFTEAGNPAQIGRITPTGTITYFSQGLDPQSDPTSIASGPDGNLWFTQSAAIGRITPSGTITEYTHGLPPNADPTSIAAGPDGNLWFTEAGHPTGIGQITPTGAITEYTQGVTPGSDPASIVAGPDGNLWFTEAAGPGRIGQITPTGTVTELPTPSAGSAPDGIAAGPDGRVWFTETGNGGALGAVTPAPPSTATQTTAPPTTAATTTTPATTSTTPTGTTTPTTQGPGAPPAGATQNPAPPATPALDRTAVAAVATGTVLVKAPGAAHPQTVTSTGVVPIGSLVDATHGVLRLTTALSGAKHTQAATVWGGQFVLRSTRAGRITFDLSGALECARRHRAAHAGLVRTAVARHQRPKPRKLTLWARDDHGQYSTRGYNSVATVRGTWWKTVTSCAGTLTYVKRGVVSVDDLRRHRTVLVRAGHRYFARG